MKDRILNVNEIKKIAIVAKINPNLTKDMALLKEILVKYNVEILLEKTLATMFGQNGYEICDLAKICDCIISLGGDGTIISVCRQSAEISPFVLGIHAGRLGFLTDITVSQSEKFFADFFKGEFLIESPRMLDVILHRKNGEISHKIAFNEATILSAKTGSVINVDAFLNDKIFNSYFGDGVIISTPVGSTAYNMSVGGAIIYPLSDVFSIAPICSHSLTQRPVVLPLGFEIKFQTQSKAALVIDGQERYKMSEFSHITVRLSDIKARLIRHVGRDYFQILKEKLNWGV
ncbi:MAG: NAD(+) kinase [Campylobacter sp.]